MHSVQQIREVGLQLSNCSLDLGVDAQKSINTQASMNSDQIREVAECSMLSFDSPVHRVDYPKDFPGSFGSLQSFQSFQSFGSLQSPTHLSGSFNLSGTFNNISCSSLGFQSKKVSSPLCRTSVEKVSSPPCRTSVEKFKSTELVTSTKSYQIEAPVVPSHQIVAPVVTSNDRNLPSKRRVISTQPLLPARTRRKKWSKEEDQRLMEGVAIYGVSNWKRIKEYVGTRNNRMCAQRWRNNVRPELKSVNKGSWRKEEDDRLRELVEKNGSNGSKTWELVSQGMGWRRNSKQCRERWMSALDPSLRLDAWTDEEDAELLRLHSCVGNSWTILAEALPGRTPERIKRRLDSLKKNAR